MTDYKAILTARMLEIIARLPELPGIEREADPASIAQQIAAIGNVASIRNADIRLLGRLTAAIARINAGTFGICRTCRETIPGGRLRIVPEAEFCLDCQTDLESAGARVGRAIPITEGRSR